LIFNLYLTRTQPVTSPYLTRTNPYLTRPFRMGKNTSGFVGKPWLFLTPWDFCGFGFSRYMYVCIYNCIYIYTNILSTVYEPLMYHYDVSLTPMIDHSCGWNKPTDPSWLVLRHSIDTWVPLLSCPRTFPCPHFKVVVLSVDAESLKKLRLILSFEHRLQTCMKHQWV